MADGTPITLYHDDCTTCLEAKEWLDHVGYEVDERDLIASALTATEIEELADDAGDVRSLVRDDLREEADELAEEEVPGYLATDPYRVEHPIAVLKDRVHVGFTAEVRQALSS